MFKSLLTLAKISVKQLSFISNPLRSPNCLRGWKSLDMAVKYLFIGGEFLQEMQLEVRLNCGRIKEIEHDRVVRANSDLLHVAPQTNERSGRYRHEAVPT